MKAIVARCLGSACLILLALPVAAASSRPDIIVPASTTSPPISAFVSAQNASICKGAGFILWEDPARTRLLYVDYYGYQNSLLDLGLGTTTDGVVTESRQEDGRIRVHVVLHTSNALTWVTDDPEVLPGTPKFGHTPAEVQAGATAALGDSTLTTDFLMPEGPLPDFCQLIFQPGDGQEFLSFRFTAGAEGALRAGSGLPEGTPGATQGLQEQDGDVVLNERVGLFVPVP
jgi:hypothetical protein